MKASDARQGMFVIATANSTIDGKKYWAGDIGYICNIAYGAPRVRRVIDDVMLGSVAMQNWEPYEPAPPAPAKPDDEFVAAHAACPWCGSEWRWVDIDKQQIRWRCESWKPSASGGPVQSETCKIACGEAAIEKLYRLRELMDNPAAAMSISVPVVLNKINEILSGN